MTLEKFIISSRLITGILSGIIIGTGRQWQLKIAYTLLFICCMCSCKAQKTITDKAGDTSFILNKEWIVIQIGDEKIEQLSMNHPPNLKLLEDKISGYSSCNRFHGNCIMQENKITFSHIVITKMLCTETNDIESLYLKALSDVQFWEHKGGKLYFLNQEKQTVIIFK